MIIWMYKLNVGVPRDIALHPEAERNILGETQVIRVSLIREHKHAGWQRVPCVRRNRSERLSQLCRKRWFSAEPWSVFDPPARSASTCEELLAMRESPIKPSVPSTLRVDTISV
jgi:hypothetical protein